jgi:DUF1365 family protein
MEMNSCLYKGSVVHHRKSPLEHRFVYPYLTFYLDLDELPTLEKKLFFLGWNKFNLFSFWDKDHLKVIEYAKEKGVDLKDCKIYLLTQLRILGYVFNPVSFYFCTDKFGEPLCTIAEVSNTFKEKKLYFLGPHTFKDQAFKDRQVKHFYISPFISLEEELDFLVKVPKATLSISINEKTIQTALTGKKTQLTNFELIRCFFLYPLITLRVIWAIHWQAFKLYRKKIPFFKKSENPHLQTEVHNVYGKTNIKFFRGNEKGST